MTQIQLLPVKAGLHAGPRDRVGCACSRSGYAGDMKRTWTSMTRVTAFLDGSCSSPASSISSSMKYACSIALTPRVTLVSRQRCRAVKLCDTDIGVEHKKHRLLIHDIWDNRAHAAALQGPEGTIIAAACLVEVEDEVQLAHVAEVAVQHLHEVVDDLRDIAGRAVKAL